MEKEEVRGPKTTPEAMIKFDPKADEKWWPTKKVEAKPHAAHESAMSFGMKDDVKKQSEKDTAMSLVSYRETDNSEDKFYNEEEMVRILGVDKVQQEIVWDERNRRSPLS